MAKEADVSESTIKEAKAAHKAGLSDAVRDGGMSAKQAANLAKGKTGKPRKPRAKPKVTAPEPQPPEDVYTELEARSTLQPRPRRIPRLSWPC